MFPQLPIGFTWYYRAALVSTLVAFTANSFVEEKSDILQKFHVSSLSMQDPHEMTSVLFVECFTAALQVSLNQMISPKTAITQLQNIPCTL